MSGCTWNLKKMMEELKETFLQIIFQLFFPKKFMVLSILKEVGKEGLNIRGKT